MPTMDVIESLKQELAEVSARRREAELEEKRLQQAVALLEGGDILISGNLTHSREYEGLGIVDAAIRYLTEAGEPRSTGEIKDALLSRGWSTASKNPTATIYATLDNSPKIKRTKDQRWEIVK